MNTTNSRALMTIKEGKEKLISQIAAIGRKYRTFKYPILLFAVPLLLFYNLACYSCKYFKAKERMAKAVAMAMCVILCVTSTDIVAFASIGDAGEAAVKTDGFSYYTVEFSHGELQYVLAGDEKVELTTVLEAVGIQENGEITAVEGSDDELFKPVLEDDVWYIEAVKAFGSEEWLKVTIDGIEYEIVVTDDQTVTTWEELQSALAGTGGTIKLGGNITAESGNTTIEVSGTKILDLNGYVINAGGKCGVISVSSGATLTLEDSSDSKTGTITGGTGTKSGSDLFGGGVYVASGGNFVMNGGTISNCSAKNGGGVYVNGGSFKMTGGMIKNNTLTVAAQDGVGVFIHNGGGNSGRFEMSGGTISGNNGGGWGGGVNINAGCIFIMSGGTISGNSSKGGGGVFVGNSNAEFEMTGGTISGNTATATQDGGGGGGGVYVNNTTKGFKMSGGTISDNNAKGTKGIGGGVVVGNSATTIISGGDISRNTAEGNGGGAHISGTFTMTGGAVSNNKGYCGGGFEVDNGSNVQILGGKITGNEALLGGGINADYTLKIADVEISGNTATLNEGCAGVRILSQSSGTIIGGKTVIKNNTVNGKENNLYLYSNATITLGTGATGSVAAPTDGFFIGVTLQNGTGNVTGTTGTGQYAQYFSSDKADYQVYGNDDRVYVGTLSSGKVLNVRTGDVYDTIAAAINEAENEDAIRLLEDISENSIAVPNEKEITLDINGKKLNSTSISGKLNIKDSASSTTAHYFKYHKLAAWTLYDDASDDEKNSAITLEELKNIEEPNDSTIVKINGGIITGGTLNLSNGTVTMNGGTIIGNSKSGDYGGGVYVSSCNFTMNDGAAIIGNHCSFSGAAMHTILTSSDF